MKNNVLRTALCFAFVVALFLTCIARIAAIVTSEKISASINGNTTLITVGRLRGNIFDCNGIPLTGTRYKNYAVITPTPLTVTYCSTVLYGEQKINVLAKLKNRKPILIETERELVCAGIINLKAPEHSPSNGYCAHLLGYTDSSFHGVSGIEKAYDSLLFSDKSITVRYAVGGNNQVLSGVEPVVDTHSYVTASGVALTIDNTVQAVLEKAAQRLNKGAIIVSEAGTGCIRGMVSRPVFDLNNLAASLNAEDSPFINRCLTGYNVGSVFKPCVAAAAMEKGWAGVFYDCTGSNTVDGISFACHKADGHGKLGLNSAIANSCNSYFYNLAFLTGEKSILNKASVLGFGYKKSLCEGIFTVNENLPDINRELCNIELANISIGQGALLASPVTMLSLYEAIANKGVYYPPYVVLGEVKNGEIKEEKPPLPIRAINESTANKLKQSLKEVVESGTGKKAFSSLVTLAGKTATAETGWENGRASQHSWFCGFFPFESPKYVAVVLVEDSEKDEGLAAEIFKEIAEGLCRF
ncbi:MAG: penicillin-binding protein 2 [Clostridia bacterium]|nr:penicillin-binding protein 2 [Clostridia bacterium]